METALSQNTKNTKRHTTPVMRWRDVTKICCLAFLVHVLFYEVFVAKNAQPSGVFMERVKDTKTSNIVATWQNGRRTE